MKALKIAWMFFHQTRNLKTDKGSKKLQEAAQWKNMVSSTIQITISLYSVLETRLKEAFKVWKKKWILQILLRTKRSVVMKINKLFQMNKLTTNLIPLQIKIPILHRILRAILNRNQLHPKLSEIQIHSQSKMIFLRIRKFLSCDFYQINQLNICKFNKYNKYIFKISN